MNKLIKLSDTHYIIVDDSKIKEDDYYLNLEPENPTKSKIYKGLKLVLKNGYEGNGYKDKDYFKKYMKKIIHSTQPLEQYYGASDGSIPFVFHKIKPLSLSEIEEVINSYNIEKLLDEYEKQEGSLKEKSWEEIQIIKAALIIGFKTHRKLVKDKLFTIEDMRKAFELGLTLIEGNDYNEEHFQKLIQSLLPKTEWNIELVDGKIKLI